MTASGDTVIMGFDIGDAPVPSRRYVCDTCSVELRDDDLKLIFAQRSLGEDGLDSALVVRLNPLAAIQFVESLEAMKNPTIEEIAERVGIKPQALSVIGRPPKQIANVIANFVAVAVSGWESCLDFYHASPFAMRAASGKRQLEIEPVVRVDIRTSLFISLVAELRLLAKQLPRIEEASHGPA